MCHQQLQKSSQSIVIQQRREHVLLCGGSTAVHIAKWSSSPEMIKAVSGGCQAVWIEIENLFSLVLFFFKREE